MVKQFYCLLISFFIVVTNVVAQNEKVFNITKLPEQDTLLTGWRFQAGDNPEYSKPELPQDIGRVLLNLYTNAFYTVSEKRNSNRGIMSQLFQFLRSLSKPLQGLG